MITPLLKYISKNLLNHEENYSMVFATVLDQLFKQQHGVTKTEVPVNIY